MNITKERMTSNPDAIVISNLGMHSSFGGVVQAAAAFRCGLSRAQELTDWPYFDEETRDEQFFIGLPVAGVTDGFQEIGRFLKMGVNALADMQRYSSLPALNSAKIGVFFVFSKEAPSDLKKDPGFFLTRLWQLSQIKIETKNIRTYFEGRVGVMSAILEAIELLKGGAVDYCLIGTIDSHLNKHRLEILISTGRIKTVDNPIGLVPGEAACFILIERLSNARRRGATPEIILPQPSRAVSSDGEDDEQMPTGRALSEVMVEALENAHVIPTEPGTIYCDLNGEVFRATDFGNALMRLSAFYPIIGAWNQEIPAISFGDTGAASGILPFCLAIRAFSRGYCVGNKALIVLSSEQGDRGAIVLRRFENATSFSDLFKRRDTLEEHKI
jgi:3-oxoacyl-[acyl-carrier-protein] synthase-1